MSQPTNEESERILFTEYEVADTTTALIQDRENANAWLESTESRQVIR